MNRKLIDRKDGHMGGRVSKQLISGGGGQIPENKSKIGAIRRSLGNFVKRQKEGWNSETSTYKRRVGEIKGVSGDFRIRYKSISPLKDTGDFDDGEPHGFSCDYEQNKDAMWEEIEIEMEGRWGIIDAFGNDTEEMRESKLEYVKLKGDLEREIISFIGCEWARGD